MWRSFDVSKRLMILSRGSVALRPAFLRSLGEVISGAGILASVAGMRWQDGGATGL